MCLSIAREKNEEMRISKEQDLKRQRPNEWQEQLNQKLLTENKRAKTYKMK